VWGPPEGERSLCSSCTLNASSYIRALTVWVCGALQHGHTPLSIARDQGHTEIVKICHLHAVRVIQRQWQFALYDPRRLTCRTRLLAEFRELDAM
jgi:hypothetical protein